MLGSSQWSHRALALALASSFVLSALPAAAQKTTNDPRYKEGLKFEKEMNFAAAIAAYSQIPAAQRLPATRIHLAKCEAGLGHMLTAEAALLTIIADPKVPDTTKSVAQGDLDLLREKMPKLTIALADSAAGAKVTLDGTEVTTFPATRALDPGVHAVVATKGLKVIYQRDVTLEEGRKVDVNIDDPDFVAKKAEEAKAKDANDVIPTPLPRPAPRESGKGWVPWAVGGAGVVFLGGFVFARVMVGSAATDRENACLDQHTHGCDDTGSSKLQTWRTVSYVAGGLAAVGLGAGIYLLVKPSSSTSTTMGLAPTAGGAAFQLQGTF